MNEKLKELAKQADEGYTGNSENDMGDSLVGNDAIKKFAELIIKDYEKLLPEICPWVDADQKGPMYGWHVRYVARKHFGVTE